MIQKWLRYWITVVASRSKVLSVTTSIKPFHTQFKSTLVYVVFFAGILTSSDLWLDHYFLLTENISFE